MLMIAVTSIEEEENMPLYFLVWLFHNLLL